MKYFSLFSGVGGFELGITQAYEDMDNRRATSPPKLAIYGDKSESDIGDGNGGRADPVCVGFSEVDKYASQVLRFNHPNTKNYGDITKIDWNSVPDFDLLVGGSPCQDFSIAGKRAGISGARSGLVWEYIRCLEEKKPAYFIFENVKGLLSSGGGLHFATILTAFSEAGYSLWWQVLNAKDFGVPQNRERIFVCGFRDGSPPEVFFEPGADEQNHVNIVAHKKGYRRNRQTFSPDGLVEALDTAGGGGRGHHVQICPSIRATQHKSGDNQTVIAVLTPDRLKKRQNGRRMKTDGEPMFTLNAQDKHGVYINANTNKN